MINNVWPGKRAYKVIVGAADGLRGARITTRADNRDRVAVEPNETRDVGKGDPEQGAEDADRRVIRLQGELCFSTKG